MMPRLSVVLPSPVAFILRNKRTHVSKSLSERTKQVTGQLPPDMAEAGVDRARRSQVMDRLHPSGATVRLQAT